MEGRALFILIMSLERYTEIERENKILLEKMTRIMQNGAAVSKSAQGLPTSWG
jgi:hypothetical protein